MRRFQFPTVLPAAALIGAVMAAGPLAIPTTARAQQDIARFTIDAINQIEGQSDRPAAAPQPRPAQTTTRRRARRLPHQPRLRPRRIAAAAATCGGQHVVSRGETLSGIARKEYGDGDKWSLIFYANQSIMKRPSLVVVGWRLNIPCLNPPPAAAPTRPEPEPRTAEAAVSAATPAPTAPIRRPAPTPAPAPVSAAQNLEALVAAATASAQTSGSAPTSAPTSAAQNLEALVAAATGAPAPAPRVPTTPTSLNVARPQPLSLLTAGDFAPFTHEEMENGGMFTNLATATLSEANVTHELIWVNEWSEHLDPLLTDKTYDMGFPWYRPDCESTPDNWRCKNFFFSDPVFEVLILLYSRSNDPVRFNRDSDIEGLTLCRPSGYFTFDLDQNGRNWLRDGKITLVRPQAVRVCFEKLLAGEVDAVAINEFTARQAIAEMNVGQRVVAADRALSLPTVHVLMHKTHPRARVVMYQFNTALEAIRDSGLYDEIVSRHLVRYWAEVEG